MIDLRVAAVYGVALMLPLAGCGGSGLKHISGTVTYAGEPVKNGIITFLPPDGNGPTAATTIVDGKYSVDLVPGRKQVQVEAFRSIGKRHFSRHDPSSPLVDVEEQILPERYNANTELTCEIAAGRTYDFALDK